MIFGHDLAFWIATAGATVVKLFTSPYQSILHAVSTVFAAVFFAYVFTAPAIDWLGLTPETYTTPMAALLALTGEGFMRMIINLTSDSTKVAELLRAWRGK